MMNLKKKRSYNQSIRLAAQCIEPGDLFLVLMGHFISKGGFEYEQSSRSCCVHIILEGAGVMIADGREYDVRAGDSFTFFPGTHLRYYDLPDIPWRYYWLRIDGLAVLRVLKHAGISEASPLKSFGNIAVMEDFCRKLYEDLSARNVFSVHRGVWELFEILCEGGRDDKLAPVAVRVKKLLDSLEVNVPNVNELADYFKLDRSTLYRSFKQHYHMSLKSYIEQKKLEKACLLLQNSSLNCARIAAVCGYKDPQYFSNAFKAKTGVSPAAYRQKGVI